jgi:hypothetical protein
MLPVTAIIPCRPPLVAGAATLQGSNQLEQIWARDGALKRSGGYAFSGWRFDTRWEGMTRVEWLHSNTAKPNTGSFIYEAGANYYYGKHVKVQADIGVRNDQSPPRTTGIFLTQMQLGF